MEKFGYSVVDTSCERNIARSPARGGAGAVYLFGVLDETWGMMKMSGFRNLLVVVLIAALAAGCASSRNASFSGDDSDGREVRGLSKRDHQEIRTGEEIHQEILSSFSVYTEPKANEYVSEITRTLAKVSHRPALPYQCTILYSDKIYAAAAPGGHVYITTGFIRILDNESELAGVLAHEIAEIQYQNPKYSKGKKALKAAETVAGLASGILGPYGMLAFMGVAALNCMTDEKGLPERVMLADHKAMMYMVEAGYDPQGLIDVLYKIIYTEPALTQFLVDYYNSRPVDAKRLQRIHKVFAKLPIADKSFDTHRERFLASVSSIKELYL